MKNQVRIIAGHWRGRKLFFPSIAGLRPTPDRVREMVFNWLQYDIVSARCLDLFAGSGALGFEATSREANFTLLVENDTAASAAIRKNVKEFNAIGKIKLEQQDVEEFLKGPSETFDLVFLDPPFGQGLVECCCKALENFGWLSAQSKIYVEMEKAAALLKTPDNWQQLKQKTVGTVRCYLFERKDKTNSIYE